MKTKFTKFMAAALAAVMAFALAACGGGGSGEGGDAVLKIGSTGPLTGPAAIYGNAVKNG